VDNGVAEVRIETIDKEIAIARAAAETEVGIDLTK
jgi:hypothetical protein